MTWCCCRLPPPPPLIGPLIRNDFLARATIYGQGRVNAPESMIIVDSKLFTCVFVLFVHSLLVIFAPLFLPPCFFATLTVFDFLRRSVGCLVFPDLMILSFSDSFPLSKKKIYIYQIPLC